MAHLTRSKIVCAAAVLAVLLVPLPQTIAPDWTVTTLDATRKPLAGIYGLFPEFRDYLNREQVQNLESKLGRFSRAIADESIGKVPTEWEVDRETRSAWAAMITGRAQFLADHLEQILWPQLELEGETE